VLSSDRHSSSLHVCPTGMVSTTTAPHAQSSEPFQLYLQRHRWPSSVGTLHPYIPLLVPKWVVAVACVGVCYNSSAVDPFGARAPAPEAAGCLVLLPGLLCSCRRQRSSP
jgi:hypothetical protein